MRAVDTPVGACGVGASCQAGRCVPANDNSDVSVGAGCSLELLGSGPLANPVGGGGTLVSAPAIGATSNGGFVVAYREVDPNGAGARLTILPLDSGGGAGHIAVADFNGDGKPDLAKMYNDLEIFLGNGDGTLRTPPRSTLP